MSKNYAVFGSCPQNERKRPSDDDDNDQLPDYFL